MTVPAPLPPLALTMGEPAGIGIELALKAWLALAQVPELAFVVYADPSVLTARAQRLNLTVPLAVDVGADASAAFSHALPVVSLRAPVIDQAGVLDVRNASATIEAIERAVRDTHKGLTRAVVTNPIQKSVLYQAGFAFPGHTEYLGALADQLYGGGNPAAMMLACDELRVVPVTVHIALSQVPQTLSQDLIMTTARIVAQDLRQRFGLPHPRLVVAGLNPHAGENGSMGTQDAEIIRPAVARLQQEGLDIIGPLPADTLFHARARQGYDCVLAMYHDQALIPVKTLAFDRAVNVTLGLPFVRTSPDHGTALDIAGRGLADAGSLIAALKLAHQMTRGTANGRD